MTLPTQHPRRAVRSRQRVLRGRGTGGGSARGRRLLVTTPEWLEPRSME